jgi:hypothetical protein
MRTKPTTKNQPKEPVKKTFTKERKTLTKEGIKEIKETKKVEKVTTKKSNINKKTTKTKETPLLKKIIEKITHKDKLNSNEELTNNIFLASFDIPTDVFHINVFNVGKNKEYINHEKSKYLFTEEIVPAIKIFLPYGRKLLKENSKIHLFISAKVLMYLKTHSKPLLNSVKKFCENENVILISSPYYSTHMDVLSDDEFIHQIKGHKFLLKEMFSKPSEILLLNENYLSSKKFLKNNFKQIKELGYSNIIFIPKIISGVYDLEHKGTLQKKIVVSSIKDFMQIDITNDVKYFWKDIKDKLIFTTQRYYYRTSKSDLNLTFKNISKINFSTFSNMNIIDEIIKNHLTKFKEDDRIDLNSLYYNSDKMSKSIKEENSNYEKINNNTQNKHLERNNFHFDILTHNDDYENEEMKSHLIEEFKNIYDVIVLMNDENALKDWRLLSSKINSVDNESQHEYEHTHRYENYITLMNSLNDVAYKLKTGFLLKNGLDIPEPSIVESPSKELKEVIFNTN